MTYKTCKCSLCGINSYFPICYSCNKQYGQRIKYNTALDNFIVESLDKGYEDLISSCEKLYE